MRAGDATRLVRAALALVLSASAVLAVACAADAANRWASDPLAWSPGDGFEPMDDLELAGVSYVDCNQPTSLGWRARDGRWVFESMMTCATQPSASRAAAHEADALSGRSVESAFGNDADIAVWIDAPYQFSSRIWVQGSRVVILEYGGPDVGAGQATRESARLAQDLAHHVTEVTGDVPTRPSVTAGMGDTFQRLLISAPLFWWLFVVGPVRFFSFVSRPRFSSVAAPPIYSDVKRQVNGARLRRFGRRWLWLGVLVFASILATALFPDTSEEGAASTAFGLLILSLTVAAWIGPQWFWRRHAVERTIRVPGSRSLRGFVGAGLRVTSWVLLITLFAFFVIFFVLIGTVSGMPEPEISSETPWWTVPLLATAWGLGHEGGDLLFPLVVVPTVLAVWALDRFGARLAARSLDEALTADQRPHYLYLRSFDEDRLRLPAPLLRRGPLSAFVPLRRRRFEEVLVHALNRTGPVIAVAPPGSRLRPLGAARASYDNDSWQDAVRQHAAGARAVIISGTPASIHAGFDWEIALVARDLPHARVIVIIAPWRGATRRRWAGFLSRAVGEPLFATLGDPRVSEGVHVACHAPALGWRAWGASTRTDWTYAMAVHEATSEYLPAWDVETASVSSTGTQVDATR